MWWHSQGCSWTLRNIQDGGQQRNDGPSVVLYGSITVGSLAVVRVNGFYSRFQSTSSMYNHPAKFSWHRSWPKMWRHACYTGFWQFSLQAVMGQMQKIHFSVIGVQTWLFHVVCAIFLWLFTFQKSILSWIRKVNIKLIYHKNMK